MEWVCLLAVLMCLLVFTEAQQEGNLRRGGKRKRKGRPRLNVAGAIGDKDHIKSLEINYPLNFFDGSHNGVEWKSPARVSPELLALSEDSQNYQDWAQAQDQEDVWLYENWFYGMSDGVIMESGALNGVLFSTSYMYEHFANWTAIHVEADPENYSNLKVNRQQSVNIHGALCSEPRLLHYSSEGVIPVRGFVEFMTPSFLKKWHGKVYRNITKIEDLPAVQCVPVKQLMKQVNVNHIDIWVLDTEGAEESVLRGTNFMELHINAVAMECDQHDIAKNSRKTDILEANGFKCHLIERNCMCKHNDYTPRSAPKKSELRKWDGQKWTGGYTASATRRRLLDRGVESWELAERHQ
jgi:FkbM family methyltransferase